MVKFIVGKADRNISAAVRGELVSLLEKSDQKQKIIFIVPDQFEYETEKAIYRILQKKELLTRSYEINITTFTRLCREILEECGEHRPFADDIVKNIIMHKAVSENKIALTALAKVAARPGFCGKMVKTVSALKTSGITARDLDLSLEALKRLDNKKLSPDQPVIKKLHETNTLYLNYEDLLREYIDKLDVTAMAADNVEKAKCTTFERSSVFVDCFNDFTQSQLHFLECVIHRAENVTFGFTAQLNSDCDVFRTANDHISRLKQSAEEAGLCVEFITEGIEGRFAEGSPLAGLSKHLFQNAKNRSTLEDCCELVTARDVYEELDYTAAKIKELAIDKKMRYNEIAVLCTDVGAYGKYVESTFKKYEIPIFLDTPEPILYQPLINFVSSILNALADFSIDTVLSCVKTRFFPKPAVITDYNDDEFPEDADNGTDADENGKNPECFTLSGKDVDEFENYIYEWDLKTSHLKKPFTFKDNRKENDYGQQTAELVRQAVAVPLLELRKQLHKNGKTIKGKEITEKLYDFLINKVRMSRVMRSLCKDENSGKTKEYKLDAEKTDLYQRLWNSLIDIFNKLHDELSDTYLTITEYGDLFREICAATKLADPPQFIDCVLVGDIDRTRADNIRAAFIVGASYEAFPTPASESGIFSQYEIELIYDKIVHIDNIGENPDTALYLETLSHIGENTRREYCLKSVKDQYYLSLYRAYRAITLPTEYLCISCPKTDVSGEAVTCSDVFGEIVSTFKCMEIITAESRGSEFYCRTPKAAKMRYAMSLNEHSEDNRILRKVLEKEDKEFVEALEEIRSIRCGASVNSGGKHFPGKHTLSSGTAQLLFPRSVGATAIEKLNKCKFSYFCEFGLKINERNKRSFTRSKRGEAMHFIFQKVLEEYCGDMNTFFALKRSELLALAKKYLSVYRETETNNDKKEDKRTEYLFNNIANSATDVLITMQTELFARRYRPKFFELKIKDEPDNDRHKIINNETEATSEPPAAELFSETDTTPAPPTVTPDNGNALSSSSDDGNAPSSSFDDGNAPSSSPDNGNAPSSSSDDGNAPSSSSDNGNAPSSSSDNGNAPYLITAPLSIQLDDGSEVTVQGIIDRVDMFGTDVNDSGKPAVYIRVVDYKSSAHTFDLKNAQNGINIQMLMYLFALQSANADNPTLELRPGGVNYVPSNNNGASEETLSPYRLLAMNYHESGLFIKDDVTEKDLTDYQNVIFQKFESDSSIDPSDLDKIKKSFQPKDQNTAEAKFFDKLRSDVMQKITENLDQLFGGTIDALPTAYYESVIKPDGSEESKYIDPCEYCRFKDICHNAGKNVNKIEKTKLKPKSPKKDDQKTYWENNYISKEGNVNG